MAKGRRLTTSRSEMLLGSYSYSNGLDATGTDSSEQGEEDVWSIVDDVNDRNDPTVNDSQGEWVTRADFESNGSLSIRSRRRDDRHVDGLSMAFEDSSAKTPSSRIVHQFRGGSQDSVAASPRQMATSAPVNVPDWSKILRVDSVESLHDSDNGLDDGCESEMFPPHEYLAREYTRSKKMAGVSVFEGVGRTLKGRDMRRVRDAVWSQTGFDG